MIIERLKKLLVYLVGDYRHFSLEERLFNTISLLNGLLNILGLAGLLQLQSFAFLFLTQLVTGIFFLVCYYFSRFGSAGRKLYWPFIFVTAFYIFLTSIYNGGLMGGTHYYIFPALVIGIILSPTPSMKNTMLVFLLFVSAVIGLILITEYKADWIVPYASSLERTIDVSSSLMFVEIFLGFIVLILMKNLNLERAKSDQLLVNILPVEIAAELKRNEFVVPKEYEATVLFTDFVGFTKVAGQMEPQELISELDICFTEFDQIVRRHGLEKIKTIGDSYMAAGGLPVANFTHAKDCAAAAIEMRDFIVRQNKIYKEMNKPYWNIRIGLNTGTLVAGVVGKEKFAYDIWGDTVNVASRHESSGIENEVNISESTYRQVQDLFICEARGPVQAKGKGEMQMYLVRGVKP
ncbi:MAG: adenylate/guanylate cyclase domain-containing protein [Pseudobdellovibrio sp.]